MNQQRANAQPPIGQKLVGQKLVLLKFGPGSWNSGFPVTLQLHEESTHHGLSLRPLGELVGHLPPLPELWAAYGAWRSDYGDLDLRLRLERIENTRTNVSSIELTQNCQRSAQHFRQLFNQWLKSLTFAPIREKLLEQLTPDDRIRLILQSDDAQLTQLPWHLWDWLERYPGAEIALSAPQFQPVAPPRSALRSLKILAILGDRAGIDIDRDRQMLENLPQAQVTFLVEPPRQELTEQLWAQDWDILFFAGHSQSRSHQSRSQPGPGRGEIKLNATDRLTIDELKFGLKKAVERGLQLAIFNSCDGLGLAWDLADLQIPQVMVMREPVPDRVAQLFLQYFLAAFSQGQSLYLSLRQAREQLQGVEAEFPCATWLPVLLQNPTAMPLAWPVGVPVARGRSAIAGRRPSWGGAIGLGLVITGLTLGARHFQQLEPLELQAFDQLLRLRPAEPPDQRLLVVTVTEDDVRSQPDKQRRGSLSDRALWQLVQRLEQAEARVIGLDIYRDYPAQLPALQQWMQQSDRFVAVCQVSDDERSVASGAAASGVAPPPEIAPENVGFSDGILDTDRVLRRQLVAMTPTAGACPAEYGLNTQLALRYLAVKNIHLTSPVTGALQLGDVPLPLLQVHWGGYQGIDDRGYQLLLNYRSSRSIADGIPQVTLGEVLSGKIDAKFMRDRIVLIGTTAPSFKDQALTPYRSGRGILELPGVLLQAQQVSQLVSAVLDRRPLIGALPIWGDCLWVGSWAMLGGLIGQRCRRFAWLSLATGGAVLVLLGVAWSGLVGLGYWLPLVPAAIGLVGTVGAVLVVQRWRDRPLSDRQLSDRPLSGI
jgi:CHASE2 domain-containing sensor protein